MTNEHENLQIENDLGTFEGFNHRTQSAIFPNVTADELVSWDHDRLGEAEFWHSGDKPGISEILDSNNVSASDVLALDRLLSELGDDIQTLAKLLYHIKHHGYSRAFGWSLLIPYNSSEKISARQRGTKMLN